MNKEHTRTWDCQIQLVEVERETNENGFVEETLIPKEKLLANKLSVHSSDFWLAKQNVINLEHVFEIHTIEYNGERALRFDGEDYEIERTYEKGDYIELVTSYWSDEHGA